MKGKPPPLLARAMIAFLICPGTFAFFVPLFLLAPGGPDAFVNVWALIPLVAGMTLLIWCVLEFYVAGRGTLAPWAPPQQLVQTGPYRISRNPMYIAVLLLLGGWALGFRSRPLALYAVALMFAFHLRVVLYEEPWLARTHGTKWTLYKAGVHRWVF